MPCITGGIKKDKGSAASHLGGLAFIIPTKPHDGIPVASLGSKPPDMWTRLLYLVWAHTLILVLARSMTLVSAHLSTLVSACSSTLGLAFIMVSRVPCLGDVVPEGAVLDGAKLGAELCLGGLGDGLRGFLPRHTGTDGLWELVLGSLGDSGMGFWFADFQSLGSVSEPIGGFRGFLPCRTSTGGLGDLVLVVAWIGQLLFEGSLLLAGTACWLLGLGVVAWLGQLLFGGSLLLAGTTRWLLGLGVVA